LMRWRAMKRHVVLGKPAATIGPLPAGASATNGD
jgi:hypothetical protein